MLQSSSSARSPKRSRLPPTRPRERFTTKARRCLGLLETKGAAIALLFTLAVGSAVLDLLGIPHAYNFVTASLGALLYALLKIIRPAGHGALLSALLDLLGRKEKKQSGAP